MVNTALYCVIVYISRPGSSRTALLFYSFLVVSHFFQYICFEKIKKIMDVKELINLLLEIEDKSKKVHILSCDHSNDPVQKVYVPKEDIIYICG